MSQRASLRVAVVLTATLVACDNPQPASEKSSDAEALRGVVDSTTTAFHDALRNNDTTALYSHIADDVVLMPPGEPVVRGKEAFRAWNDAFLTQYRTSSLTMSDREIVVGDGWATELGTYEWGLTPAAGGPDVVDRGNYMQVWKQQPDGRWLFAREIWNSTGSQ